MRTRGRPRHPDILTPREWEVLSLIQAGASNEEIGERLGITERTAKYHVSEILSKLGVGSREEAVAAVGERRERVGVLQWALGLKVAAMLAAVGVLAGVGVLAWSVAASGGDSSDLTVDEVYSRVLASATRPNEVLYTTLDLSTRDDDGSGELSSLELWIDPSADVVRTLTHYGAAWTDRDPDIESLMIAMGEFEYYENAPGEAYRVPVRARCPGTASLTLRALLPCGRSDPTQEEESEPRVIADAEWEGRRVVAVVMIEQTVVEPGELPEFPSGEVTFAPNPTAGQTPVTPPPTLPSSPRPTERYDYTTTSYLDPETFLPIASTYRLEYEDDDRSLEYVIRLEHEFIDRSSVAGDFFDPASIGWRGE